MNHDLSNNLCDFDIKSEITIESNTNCLSKETFNENLEINNLKLVSFPIINLLLNWKEITKISFIH